MVFLELVRGDNLKQVFKEQEEKQSIILKEKGYDTFKEAANVSHAQSIFKFLEIDNYYENVKVFYKFEPFFYDKNGIFWLWNNEEHKWIILDEIDIFNKFEKLLHIEGGTINAKIKSNYTEAFKRYGRTQHPKDAPKKWIQFKDKAFSLKSGNIYEVKPNYFFCNPIPWELSTSEETPILDKLFKEWVGEKHVQTLYEMIAYCCYTDYPIQTLFCLNGIGRNGKTSFIKLLVKFLGKNNVCSSDLDLIAGKNASRFESFKLYKRLACFMGETNFGILQSSSLLKRLTGSDLIGFEMKNKLPFDEYSYAKIIIASNSLPSSEDTSEGFYRRWLIVDFPNQFQEGKDIIETIPDQEYTNLAKKVTIILLELLKKGQFMNQGTIEERKNKYILASNPLPLFIENFCFVSPNNYNRYSNLYTCYLQFLDKIKRRIISKKEFSKFLEVEGYENRKTSKEGIVDYYVEGLVLKPDFDKLLLNYPNFSLYSTLFPYKERESIELVEIGAIEEKTKEKQKEIEEIIPSKNTTSCIILKNTISETIYYNCYICNTKTANLFDKYGKPICDLCYKSINGG